MPFTHQTFHRLVQAVPTLLLLASLGGCAKENSSETDTEGPPPEYDTYYCQNDNRTNYWTTDSVGNVKHYPDPVQVCIPWGSTEEEARAACSAKCRARDVYQVGNDNCVDAGWTEVTAQNYLCSPEAPDFNFLVLEEELGLAAAQDVAELPCDLNLTCGTLMSPAARGQLWMPVTSSAAATAATAVSTGVPVTSSLTIAGASTTSKAITGTAAYTAVPLADCGSPACPFYLAQLDGAQTSGSWTASLAIPGGSTLVKTVNNVAFSLAESTVGVWLPATGDVIFPPLSLKLKVDASISGSTNNFGENGTYTDVEQVNAGYVFGHVSSSGFTLDYTEAYNVGDVSLHLDLLD